jgi:hypothetical protein
VIFVGRQNGVCHAGVGAKHRLAPTVVYGAMSVVSRRSGASQFDSTAIAPTGGATAP